MIKTLLDAGIRLESVREVFTYLRQHVTSDIASAHIVISGSQVVLCDGDQLVDVLAQRPGRAQRAAAGRASRTTSTPSSCRSTTPPTGGAAPGHLTRDGRALAARRRPPRARRADGAVRRLGDAARVPDRHDRRAPRLPPRRRRVRRLAPRHGARRPAPTPSATLQAALTNDLGKIAPGRAQYTHLLDDADGSVLDDIIVWWHPATATATSST